MEEMIKEEKKSEISIPGKGPKKPEDPRSDEQKKTPEEAKEAAKDSVENTLGKQTPQKEAKKVTEAAPAAK